MLCPTKKREKKSSWTKIDLRVRDDKDDSRSGASTACISLITASHGILEVVADGADSGP
jgi:hypothetical protein